MTLKNDPSLYDAKYFEDGIAWFDSPAKNHFYAGFLQTLKVKSVLDVGSGTNSLCVLLRKLGIDAVGVDFSPDSKADILASADDLPFDTKSFDIVTSFDVLEHLELDQIHRSIDEFKRVGKMQAHHICFDSDHDASDDPYHVTLESRQWWLNTFFEHGLNCVVEATHFVNRSAVLPYLVLGELTCQIFLFEDA